MRNGKLVKALGAFVVLGGLSVAQSSHADFLNRGFEAPAGGALPTSWTIQGDGSIGTGTTKAPSAGNQFGYASSSQNGFELSESSSTPAQSGAALTASLGLPAIGSAGGLRANTTAGSAFTQSLSLTAGVGISFLADFGTYSGAGNGDYAFYTIRFGAGTAAATSFVDSTSGSLQTISNGDFQATQPTISADTGWSQYVIPGSAITTTGSYTIGLGVGHTNNGALPGSYSAVLVDEVTVAPLPSVAYGGMALLAGLGLMQLARRRQSVIA